MAATGSRDEGGFLDAAHFFFRRRLPLLAMYSVIADLLAADFSEQYMFAVASIPEALGLREHLPTEIPAHLPRECTSSASRGPALRGWRRMRQLPTSSPSIGEEATASARTSRRARASVSASALASASSATSEATPAVMKG